MPTKIGEAFACGVPIVCNAFNKDIRSIIEKNNCGLILNFNELEYSDLFKKFESEILALTRINNCIELSQSEFSLKSDLQNISRSIIHFKNETDINSSSIS